MSHEFRVINGPLPGSGMLSGDISRIWSSNIVEKKGKKHQTWTPKHGLPSGKLT